jgi:ribose 5-phosphate isomerase B
MVKTISIGSDHAGFVHKNAILKMLQEADVNIIDHGTHSEESTDYPDHIHPVADDVEEHRADLGVIMCGSGNGAAMTANKHQGIRAAVCWTPEQAALSRQHNNANIISIPGRFVDRETALAMVDTFLRTAFEGGRHARRVGKIPVNEDASC